MALEVGDLFSTWDEWCDTLDDFEKSTGHKFWKRRSRKVTAAKIRKVLKPELVYYEVQFDCKIYHPIECVDECPPECSKRCPGMIKLRANEEGDHLRVSKLILDGVHKDTAKMPSNDDNDNIYKGSNPFSEEDQYITLSTILSTANVSGSNSPEQVYYPPLNVDVDVDADIIKTEVDDGEEEGDESEYHHTAKRARIDDSNGQLRHSESQDSNESSGEVRIQDEFFYFGKNVECQLRQMSLDRALECQFKILEVLAQYRIPS